MLFIILLPIIASIRIAFTPNIKGYDLKVRQLALNSSILVFILTTIIWISHFNNIFLPITNNIYDIVNIQLEIDSLSIIFVLLTSFLIPIAILSTWNSITHNTSIQLILLLLLESILFITFTANNLLVFYISFEAVLIPLFIITVLQGSTQGRLRASMLLFMYTLTGSLFMLLAIIQLGVLTNTFEFSILNIKTLYIIPEAQRWIWLGIFISIAIKSPLFPLHGWLYRAHVECSLAGSILLAGIVLKLATYAYLRILIPLLPDACEYFKPIALTIGIFSLIHSSLATLRQIDSKCFVAYSSVAHMAVVLLGLSSNTINGITGAILLSIAHGLISPALFIIAGGVLYDRYHSRILRYFRGLGSYMPSLKVWFFLASVASMATPGSLNWIGEFLCLSGTFQVAPIAGFIASLTVILGALYTIWLYNQIIGGITSPYLLLTNDLTYREWTLLAILTIPTFLLGIYPTLFTTIISSYILTIPV